MNKTPKLLKETIPIYSKRKMPMLGVSEEELKRDRERLMNFIKENPYPDYKFIKYDLLLKQEQSLEQYAEYGEINHDLMKEIYENIFDKDLIKKHGERIHHRGGITALQQNYYTLLTVLKHLVDQRGLDRDTIILVFYNIKTIVSQYWDGIGSGDEKWRH